MSVVYGTGGLATLELETVDGTPPAVRVTVSGVAASTTFTLIRLCEGATQTVPGWRERIFTDSDVYLDWCAPLDRPVTYSLSTGGVVVAAATITLSSGGSAWLQDPLLPDQSIPVLTDGASNPGHLTVRGDSLKVADYIAQASSIPIMGSAYPVAFGGQVQAASGIDASMRSDDPDTAAKFRRLRAGTPILLLRTTTDMIPLPALAYIQAKVQEQPVTVHMGGTLTRWAVTGDLVAAVMQAAITGTITYDQVQQLLAGYTYDQVQAKAAGTTYLDWQKNPLIFSTL